MKKISFRVRNFDNEQFLTFDIDNEAELDEELLDFVEDEEPAGIVPIIFEEGEEFDTFSYNITDKIHLSELSNQEINAEMVLMVLRGLVLTFIDMAEYRIPLSYLVLNRNYIYVDSEYKIEFICIPLENMKEEADLISFLRNFMASLRFEPSENGDYVAKLFTYINNRAIFNLRNLLTMVEELMESMGIEIPEDDSAEIYAEYHEVEEASKESGEHYGKEVSDEPEEAVEEEVMEEETEEEAAGELREASDEPKEAVEEATEEEVAEVSDESGEDSEEEVSDEPEEAVEEEIIEEEIAEEAGEAAEEPGEDSEEKVSDEPEELVEEEVIEEEAEKAAEVTEQSEESSEEEVFGEPEEEVIEEEIAEEAGEAAEEPISDDLEESIEEETVEEAEESEENVTEEEDEVTNESREIVNKIKEKLSKNNKDKKSSGGLEDDENAGKEPKKPLFKTKDTTVTGVVIPDELDEFLAEKEFEEQQAYHEETGLKIKKNIKINRASIVKNTQEELKAAEELEKEEPAEEPEKEEPAEEAPEGANATVKSAPIPKINPYLIRVNTKERIMITKQTFKLGKASMGVDYTVKGNGAISRVHAIITNKDDDYYIKDNKSTNHTFVNGKVVEDGENELLTHDCKIVLGDEEFIFKLQ